MNGNEPLTLYVSPQAGVASFAWRPDGLDSAHFLAVPSAGEGALRKALSMPGDRRSALSEVLGRTGGLWAFLERDQQRLRLSLCQWSGSRYSPPNRILLLQPDSEIREAAVGGGTTTVSIEPGQHALLAADSLSDSQLRVWLEGLRGLPADLRAATLGSLLVSGVWTSKPAPAGGKLPWWITVLAAVLTLVLGFAAGAIITRPKPEPPKPDVVTQPIERLEDALKASKDPQVQELAHAHLGPFVLAPKPAGRREAETWMLLKLALAKQGQPVVAEFSQPANQQALDAYRANRAGMPKEIQQAVLATACSMAGGPQPVADPPACAALDAKSAEAGFSALRQFAAAKPAPEAKQP